MALRLPARARLSVGAAGGDARLPDPAVALGEGAHAGCQEAAPANPQGGYPEAREARSLHASDTQYFLPADGGALGADAARDDRALLHGDLGDPFYRHAADRGVVLVDLGFLCRGA